MLVFPHPAGESFAARDMRGPVFGVTYKHAPLGGFVTRSPWDSCAFEKDYDSHDDDSDSH